MPNKKKSLTQMPGSSKRQRADTNLTRAQEKRLAREAEEIRKKAQREEDRMNMPSMMEKGGKVKKMAYGGKVKKMGMGGGMCRGMGAATQGGNYNAG